MFPSLIGYPSHRRPPGRRGDSAKFSNGMKIDRHGRAKILTQAEIQLLFNKGLETKRDRSLFGICLYTACRIAESCTLRRADVYDSSRRVRPELMIRKGNTKGKLATRTLPVAACNHRDSGLQTSQFLAQIKCDYKSCWAQIKCDWAYIQLQRARNHLLGLTLNATENSLKQLGEDASP